MANTSEASEMLIVAEICSYALFKEIGSGKLIRSCVSVHISGYALENCVESLAMSKLREEEPAQLEMTVTTRSRSHRRSVSECLRGATMEGAFCGPCNDDGTY